MKRPLRFPLKFEKGIREVTGQRTTTPAMKAFGELLSSKIRDLEKYNRGSVNEERVQEKLRETLEVLRERGFDQSYFEMMRREYLKLPRRAPRKRVKKEFDANDVPKVTKTPLDPRLSALLGYLKVTKSG